jgi:hypothetical protein
MSEITHLIASICELSNALNVAGGVVTRADLKASEERIIKAFHGSVAEMRALQEATGGLSKSREELQAAVAAAKEPISARPG